MKFSMTTPCLSRSGRLRLLLAVLLAAVWSGPVGCRTPDPNGPANTYGLDFSLPAGAETHGAMVFFVDGVNADIFGRMLADGELPAIKKYFVDRGMYAPRAVACTPTTTIANQVSFVTGLLPGHHGVMGVNWFDRNRLIWRDYATVAQKNTVDGDYTAPTIFERLCERTTASVFFQAHRGATKFVENRITGGIRFFVGRYESVDRLTLCRLALVMDIARKRQAMPAVTVLYLLSPDFRAYGYGIDSDAYRDALRHTDRQIGRVLGDMEAAGLLDTMVIGFVSDHGHAQVGRHFRLPQYLREELGLRVACRKLWESTAFEDRLDYYQQFSTVIYGSGDRYRTLCLRRPANGEAGTFAPWTVRPRSADLRAYPSESGPVDLIATLAGLDAIDAVAYVAGANRVCVARESGVVEFRQDAGPGGPISYRSIAGTDPLGWRGKLPAAMLAGKPHAPREWLVATTGTDYPDLPDQILAHFRSCRTGDIALFSAPGWDFHPSHKAGHGGLRPADLHVPLILAGPGIPHVRLGAVRTVDTMPTLLKLLGQPAPIGVDGESMIPE